MPRCYFCPLYGCLPLYNVHASDITDVYKAFVEGGKRTNDILLVPPARPIIQNLSTYIARSSLYVHIYNEGKFNPNLVNKCYIALTVFMLRPITTDTGALQARGCEYQIVEGTIGDVGFLIANLAETYMGQLIEDYDVTL
jgi:hypothetical protein